MEDEDLKFTCLGDLLQRRIGPGTIATAIEQSGVFGWDRFGRFKEFKSESEYARKALDLVAHEAEWEWNQEPGTQSPSDGAAGDSGNPFLRYGWPDDRLPDFAAVSAGQVEMPRPQSVAKTDNANLAIISALLMFIRGDLGTKPHPEFESEAKLIDLLVDQMAGYPGMSRRNLQDKFAQAKRVTSMP